MLADISGDFNIAELCTAIFTGILALFALAGVARNR